MSFNAAVPMRLRPRLGAILILFSVGVADGKLLLRDGGKRKEPDMMLNVTVLHQAMANLAVAKSADVESQGATMEALATQQGLLANSAEDHAEEAFNLARAAVPNSKKARDLAMLWAVKTKHTAEDVVQIAEDAKAIPTNAASAARKAIMAQVVKEARQSGEAAAEKAKDWKKSRAKRVAANVAAAMEPYHLAILRAMKYAKVTHTKAISAAETSLKLASKAQELAAQAGGMQNSGLSYEAYQLMTMAHATMGGAVKLKGWAEKMYASANKINQGIGHYQLDEGIAAQRAAVTTLFNKPPDLPDHPSSSDPP